MYVKNGMVCAKTWRLSMFALRESILFQDLLV